MGVEEDGVRPLGAMNIESGGMQGRFGVGIGFGIFAATGINLGWEWKTFLERGGECTAE